MLKPKISWCVDFHWIYSVSRQPCQESRISRLSKRDAPFNRSLLNSSSLQFGLNLQSIDQEAFSQLPRLVDESERFFLLHMVQVPMHCIPSSALGIPMGIVWGLPGKTLWASSAICNRISALAWSFQCGNRTCPRVDKPCIVRSAIRVGANSGYFEHN